MSIVCFSIVFLADVFVACTQEVLECEHVNVNYYCVKASSAECFVTHAGGHRSLNNKINFAFSYSRRFVGRGVSCMLARELTKIKML